MEYPTTPWKLHAALGLGIQLLSLVLVNISIDRSKKRWTRLSFPMYQYAFRLSHDCDGSIKPRPYCYCTLSPLLSTHMVDLDGPTPPIHLHLSLDRQYASKRQCAPRWVVQVGKYSASQGKRMMERIISLRIPFRECMDQESMTKICCQGPYPE